MNLNQITANIRLRSVWEAIDLGFVMVQEWWKAIYLPLAILTLGISIPLFYFLPEKNYWLGGFIIWWLKPLYDRLVLHIISHKLFGEELTSSQALKALPSLIWNTGLFQTLTFRRFSFSRGFNLPIWQLEQLRGEPRAQRQRILHIAVHSQAVWLTITLWLVEVIMLLSLFVLLLMFLPSETASDFVEGVFTDNLEYKRWIDGLNSIFYVLVVTLIHPFYIAGNFALYINRRTQLEAWDIELDFKKMGQRLDNLTKDKLVSSKTSLTALLLISTFVFGGINTSPVIAEEAVEILAAERKPVEKSREVIDEVMLTRNLNDKKKETKWVKIKKEEDKEEENKSDTDFDWIKDLFEPIGLFIAQVFEFALWILVALGIFLLFYTRDRWLHLFQRGNKKIKDEYTAPEVMFGMDVRPESLPEDIVASSKDLWQQGKHRESLSLLYRGALIRLINQEKVRLENSHTEGDVLKHSIKKLVDSTQGETKLVYLKTLTRQWQTIAYAHRTPDEATMQGLFNNWSSDFAVAIVSEDDEGATHG